MLPPAVTTATATAAAIRTSNTRYSNSVKRPTPYVVPRMAEVIPTFNRNPQTIPKNVPIMGSSEKTTVVIKALMPPSRIAAKV